MKPLRPLPIFIDAIILADIYGAIPSINGGIAP
jgi:hypothetical protein